MKNILLLTIASLLAFSSCKLYDPEEITPSYIYIEDIVVNAKSTEGTSIDNIIDAWVYINGSIIGVFELPAKIPVHLEGEYDLEIFGGIKKNGLTALRIQHDFFYSYKKTMNSTPLNVDTLVPVMEYEDGLTFWLEEFEDPGIKFTSQSYSDTSFEITLIPSEVLEGNGSGKIEFNGSHLLFESKTNEVLFNTFPKGGSPVYLEFDYKSNEILTLGIYHNNNSTTSVKEELINLNSSNNVWKKAYINLTELVSTQTRATEFDIYFEVNKLVSSRPLIFIDNIKVIF